MRDMKGDTGNSEAYFPSIILLLAEGNAENQFLNYILTGKVINLYKNLVALGQRCTLTIESIGFYFIVLVYPRSG